MKNSLLKSMANRGLMLIVLTAFFLQLFGTSFSLADGVQGSSIASGVKFYQLDWQNFAGQKVKVSVLEADLTNPLVEVRPVLATGKVAGAAVLSDIVKGYGAAGAVNGSFFDTSTKLPIGNMVLDGKLLAQSDMLRTSVGITEQQQLFFGYFHPEVYIQLTGGSQKIKVDGINRYPQANGVFLFTSEWGDTTGSSPAEQGLVEVVVTGKLGERGQVKEVVPGGAAIPKDGYVISFRGEAALQAAGLTAGDSLNTRVSYPDTGERIRHLLTAGPLLVEEGVPLSQGVVEGFKGSILGTAPRTAIGVTKDKRLLLVVVDGRQESSPGLTLDELAFLMVDLGAVSAAGLDGGGSSEMVVGKDVVTTPSDGRERSVNNAILILSQIKVFLNGERLFFDVPPLMQKGRVLVPMRKIFESLGATISWDDATQTVTAFRDGQEVKLAIGDKKAFINGKETALDVPAQMVDGRTLVPLRFVGEAFNAQVEWQQATQSVRINLQ